MSTSIARMTIDAAFAIMADAFRADSSMDDIAEQLIRSEPNVPEGAVVIPPPPVEEQQTVRAAGIMFIEPAGSVLMLKRGEGGDYPDTWCFPGGRLEGEESSEQGAIRETIEEIGFMPKGDRVILTRRNAGGVDYTTFIQQVPEKFIPVLSDEHTGFMWFDPRPESNALSARRDAGFDPSEARESSGEWTAGGGGGKAAPESPDQGVQKGESNGRASDERPGISGTSDPAVPAPYTRGNSGDAGGSGGRSDTARIRAVFRSKDASPAPVFHELDTGSGKIFAQHIEESKSGSKFGAAVNVYPPDEYDHMRVFTTPDAKAGFALHDDDIVSVFRKSDGPKDVAHAILKLAVQEGGKRLDCFDTILPDLYSRSGFRAVARLPFNDDYKPEGWDYKTFGKFNNGRPDVVFMVHDPEHAAAYKPGDGKQIADYDEGSILQHKAVSEKATAKSLLDAQDEPKTTPDTVIDQFDPEVRGLIKEAETRLAAATPTDAPVEQGGYKMPNGQYTPEREELHNKIIAGILSPEAIKRAKPPSGEKPTFVILGGRGGSGKSQLTREGGPVDARKFIVFDNDKIKEQIPEYKGWNAAMVHEEATHVFERAEALAREKGLNVVHDATMKTMKNSVAFAKAYKDAGYRVEGYYMFLPPHEAAKRAVERFVRAGRYVPPSYVLGSRSNEETFDALKPQFDKWGLYDNNVPSGQKARFIGGGGKD